jgi:hypothetical protein
MAWLPTKLSPYLTGIIAVDMFFITIVASGISTLAYLIYVLMFTNLFERIKQNNSITIQVDYYNVGPYNERNKNIIYESLSWLISEQAKNFKEGKFILDVLPTLHNKDKIIIPETIILPINNHEIIVEFERRKFIIKYKIPENSKTNSNETYKYNVPYVSMAKDEKPSIYLTLENSETIVSDISRLLYKITMNYLNFQRKINGRFRYENKQTRWQQIQKLASCRGLESIALNEEQEILIKKELNSFTNNKSFYEKFGMPYRRGILLYGKPGTGKTSLINAISSYLSRDIYYLNLKMVKDDNELSALFSSVPPNQLIIIEDVDAQSDVLHDRTKVNRNFTSKNINNQLNDISSKDTISNFSLSKFLECLDGNIISEGNIIIMTTNHIEILDPACIRPGRMDVHHELGYCTHYQLNKLFKLIIDESGIPEDTLKSMNENLLPPCEFVTLLTLYHKDKKEIVIDKINELIKAKICISDINIEFK